MKSFMNEFRDFINRGNVLDMAVGIIIGGAFTAIVTSLSDDIISPILGLFGGLDFKAYVLTLGSVEIAYGKFITAVINFLIMALIVFCMVKAMNRATSKLKKEEEIEEAATTKVCPYCKSEISIEATRCPHCTSQLEA
ncbi:large conductance mechanosensitive channel protein MscL [Faecalicoccus pleomorphus]|uniref:Large-conductance mechanosensitive channel n=1 Tax=Faecalicoccus pleomorphus TaxID=1323 RepID=A0A380LMT1_9FIRM|nr:large conductance mechanosensitive channel protein MscL [Faecalicoccus pleomorphus]MBM6807734.1 large conductance mechanosensitive channel protein MscL [Faecalicoccus pleomorphus]MDB7987372.1 large conductance mechanosensitive channel protein MscL [Faecalicoccus pleomorphus]MDB7991380.1 large conductance mechanosensitive channel protein MscL [Faecalicoccus pleomorphus]SUO05089.1 large conductance mechanosensitive channel [Faecalicoccus pleomorphus]